MDYQNYTVTNDISKANAWVSFPDETSCVKDFIIPNKIYPLIKQIDNSIDEEDYYILTEDGVLSMYYMCHAGNFVIVKDKEN